MNGYPDNKQKARAQEEPFFDTGKPCKYGHYSVRYTSGQCFQCRNGYNKEEYDKRNLLIRLTTTINNRINLKLTGYPINAKKAKKAGVSFYWNGLPCKYGHYSLGYIGSNGKGCCHQCRLDNKKQWREKNLEYCKEKCREWHHENKEYANAKSREYNQLYYEVYKDEINEKERERYWENLEKERERGRKYHEENKEACNKRTREWYWSNKEHKDAKNREWRENNKERHNQKSKEWREENKEYHRQLIKDWTERNKEQDRERKKQWREENYDRVKAFWAKRRSLKNQAIPPWFEEDKVKQFYENCPEGHEVDHIIPIFAVNSEGVHVACGLHCLNNLQYLTIEENRQKSNRPPELANNFLD